MLQYYLHISEPDKLSDEAWAMKIRHLLWIRQQEAGK